MRYRLMAAYRGVPYHVGLGPGGTDATLLSPASPPEELGFSAAGDHWRKQVSVTDLDALWQSRLVGDYRGEPCLVLDDFGDRLHVAYLGRDSARARQLGYWEIDREVFEVVVGRQDITGLTEERVAFPLASAMFPPPHGGPAAQAPGAPWQAADRAAAWHGSPETEPWAGPEPRAEGEPRADPEPETAAEAAPPGRRAARRERVPQSVFAELLSLAAIPHTAYAVDEEVPGAMCLVKADGGFEVFSRTDDARLDVRFFEDEEAAYFYLFGVLAAEAVRSGRLRTSGPNGQPNGSHGPGVPWAATENVSKYLRRRKLPKSASPPAMVNLPAGLTVPRSPSSPVGLPNHRSQGISGITGKSFVISGNVIDFHFRPACCGRRPKYCGGGDRPPGSSGARRRGC